MKHFFNQIQLDYCFENIQDLVWNRLNENEQAKLTRSLHLAKLIAENFQEDEIFNWESCCKNGYLSDNDKELFKADIENEMKQKKVTQIWEYEDNTIENNKT